MKRYRLFLSALGIAVLCSLTTIAQVDGVYTVTESYTIIMEYDGWGSENLTTTQRFTGNQTASVTVRNGSYSLMDRTAIPGAVEALGRSLDRTIIRSGGRYVVNGENLFLRPIQTSQMYGIVYLGFFVVSVPIPPDEVPGAVFRFNQLTTSGSDLGSLQSSGSMEFVSLTVTVSSTVTMVGAPRPPSIPNPPANATVSVGSLATFTVNARGTAPLIYQWRKNGANLTDGGNITGTRTATLRLSNVTTNDAGNYDVIVSNSLGSLTSAAAMLTVNRLPQSITFAPLQPKRLGEPPFNLAATANSGLPVIYTSSTPAVAIVSASTVTITGGGSTTITASQPGDSTYLPAPSVSQALQVTINERPVVSLQLQPEVSLILTGAVVTLTATATDPDGSIQSVHLKSGTNLLGSFESSPFSLIWSNIPLGQHQLTAEATDSFGLSSTSSVVSLNAIFQPVLALADFVPPTNALRLTASVRGGVRYRLEGSENLQTWVLLQTNTPSRPFFSTTISKTNNRFFLRLIAE